MTTNSTRLSVRAIKPLLSGLTAMGHDPVPILAATGISRDAIDDVDGWVPGDAGMKLLAIAVQMTDDDNLGFHLAKRAELRTVDLHYYAVASNGTLALGFEALCRYQRLIHDSSAVTVTRDGAGIIMRHAFSGGFPAPRQSAEFIVTSWVRVGRRVTGCDWAPIEVRFAHPAPAACQELGEFFKAPVRFSAGENALVLSPEVLSLPCVDADPFLASMLDKHAGERLAALRPRATFLGRARDALEAQLLTGDASARALATRLKMSVRTLNRMLAGEDTTYRQMLEQMRRELAARHLAAQDLSIPEVTFVLGFSDVAAFHRAFKRWTGQTPGEYRRRSQLAQTVS